MWITETQIGVWAEPEAELIGRSPSDDQTGTAARSLPLVTPNWFLVKRKKLLLFDFDVIGSPWGLPPPGLGAQRATDMEFDPSDSSGTDDDLPPPHQNRGIRGGQVTGNGRATIGAIPYARMQNDMETQIHRLEQEAYSSVLRAFKAQSDAITWAQTLPGVSSMKSMQYPSAGPSGRSQVASRNSSGAPMIDPAKKTPYDPLIGRKVMTRWPEDNNFYEAVITDYNPVELSVQCVPTYTEYIDTWYTTVPYCIECTNPLLDRYIPSVPNGMVYYAHSKFVPCSLCLEVLSTTICRGGGIPGAGRGRGTMKNQAKKQFPPAQNGIGKKRAGDIEILHTETVIKEVCILRIHGTLPTVLSFDRIFMEHCQLFRHLTAYFSHISLSCSNQVEKEHEQSLIDVIAMLADASDGESEEGEHQFPHQQQSMKWGNRRQYGGNHQGDKYRGDDVTAGGGREGSDGDHLVGHGDDDGP
ncbi:hypothetical protein BHM03_00048340 [Ensete ventricosum]|nr:hypothetical protein BHM03_00048340 [Ensete ventricosum]